MIRICICDDSFIQLNNAYEIVNNYSNASGNNIIIDELSPSDIVSLISESNFSYNIAILDIDMGDINGIDVAKKINVISPNCKVVFLTSYTNFISDSYEADHVYYVLKDNATTTLPRALDKAITSLTIEQDVRYLSIVSARLNYSIPMPEIIYIEKSNRSTIIHTNTLAYPTYISLSNLLAELPDNFVQCHNSYIINLNYVASTTYNLLTLKDGIDIPIGRYFSKKFKECYLKHIASVQ